MKKHAYLIMAHNEPALLKKLIKELDDSRADIYLHIDKKWKTAPVAELESICERSTLTIVNRTNVSWGGDTQIKCELLLLKAATKNKYQYYHLLSGVDFPLKTQDQINTFFDAANGAEFFKISDLNNENGLQTIEYRIMRYWFFQNKIGNYKSKGNRITIGRILYGIEKRLLTLQKMLVINRLRKYPHQIYKGSNWFSITDDLARYVLSKEKEIKKVFGYSKCADELFLQTIAKQSTMSSKIENNSLRMITWKSGSSSPETYTEKELELLYNSRQLFARKFSYELYPEVVDKLIEKLHNNMDRE